MGIQKSPVFLIIVIINVNIVIIIISSFSLLLAYIAIYVHSYGNVKHCMVIAYFYQQTVWRLDMTHFR